MTTEHTAVSGPAVIPDLLASRADQHPDWMALWVVGQAPLTFADWSRRSLSTAHGLRRRGVVRGDRVALVYEGVDWLDYAIAYLAILRAGAAAVHLTPTLGWPEVRRRLTQCGVTGVVHGTGIPVPTLPVEWTATLADLATGETTPVDPGIGPDDLADILYTSGTTGVAKPVLNPHGNVTFNRGVPGMAPQLDPRPLVTPVRVGTTSSATIVTATSLTMPVPVVPCDPDDIEAIGAVVERVSAGAVMMPPWIAIQLLNRGVIERYDFSSVTRMAFASAALPPAIADRLRAAVPGVSILRAYSQSEASPALAIDEYAPERPGALGRPGPGTEVRIADDTGEPVPAGVVGEIWLRGEAPKRRYLDDTLNTYADGWTHTGDLGHLDEDGYLHVFDRRVDAVRTHAGLVSTIAVEATLYEHPGVREAAAFGVPRPEGGDVLAAAVVLADPTGLDDVRTHLADRLLPHQVPEHLLVLDAVPRGITGKPRKRELRDLVARR